MMTSVTAFLTDGFNALGENRLDAAREAFSRAARLEPFNALALYGVGFASLRQSEWRRALTFLIRAARAGDRRVPERVLTEIQLASGLCHRRLDANAPGTACYRRAAILEPANPQALANLTNALSALEAREMAKRVAGRAVILDRASSGNWNAKALLEMSAGAFGAAETDFHRALILFPAQAGVWNNLGILHKHQDNIGTALQCFRQAQTNGPTDAEVLRNLGRNQLLVGDFHRGWRSLEAPWRARGFAPRNGSFRLPVWNGQPLAGTHLLLWSEEKIGEEIMFSTVLEDVRARAGPTTVLCNPRISDLLAAAWPTIDVKGWDGEGSPPVALSRFGACYPLEYVGRFVRSGFGDFPTPKPFLKPQRISAATERKPAVGIHWRSANPLVGDYKSIPLRNWAPILATPGIDFVSLQYGPVRDEIGTLRDATGLAPRIPDHVDQLSDVAGFADFVSMLDLVISVSSTTVHVAGGLGIPTWLLLPRGPGLSWYWFKGLSTSPWYPNVKIHRQSRVGDWSPVMVRVAEDLAKWKTGSDPIIADRTASSH